MHACTHSAMHSWIRAERERREAGLHDSLLHNNNCHCCRQQQQSSFRPTRLPCSPFRRGQWHGRSTVFLHTHHRPFLRPSSVVFVRRHDVVTNAAAAADGSAMPVTHVTCVHNERALLASHACMHLTFTRFAATERLSPCTSASASAARAALAAQHTQQHNTKRDRISRFSLSSFFSLFIRIPFVLLFFFSIRAKSMDNFSLLLSSSSLRLQPQQLQRGCS